MFTQQPDKLLDMSDDSFDDFPIVKAQTLHGRDVSYYGSQRNLLNLPTRPVISDINHLKITENRSADGKLILGDNAYALNRQGTMPV